MSPEKQLQVINLSCVRQHKPLFSNLSFKLHPGDILLIEGPNGSGKSSLLRLLTGLTTPSMGEIFWQDKSIQHLLADYWNELHYVGHTNGIKLGLTVTENLQAFGHLSLSTSIPFSTYEHWLSVLQLSPHENSPARQLSAGQKRRLALAKLFLFPKLLWILDEPLTALDSHTQILFLSQLELHLKKGGIAIVSSHHSFALKEITAQTLRLQSC